MAAIAGLAELSHCPVTDKTYATFSVNGHRETWAVRSRGFSRWLMAQFYNSEGKAPSGQALHEAIALIDARARFDGRAEEVSVRVGRHGDTLYLDLVNKEWEVVEINVDGWRIVAEPPMRFTRTAGMLALPRPEAGGNLEELRQLINVVDNDQWKLILTWLTAAFRPAGPYPVLVLHGEQGSAKSTTTRLLRALIDPNKASARSEPKDIRDVMIAATNSWLPAFDNLSHLPSWLSDVLCRLATGGGFGTRELYSDGEEVLFNAQRPLILNGIEEIVTRPDLLDRSLIIDLPSIPKSKRRTEAVLHAEFQTVRPRLLGAILNLVSAALRHLPDVKLDEIPRMADFATWGVAVEAAAGWPAGSFMRAYDENKEAADDLALEASPVAGAVLKFADTLITGANGKSWEGTATDLLAQLSKHVDPMVLRQKSWPTSPRGLTNCLRRLKPNLATAGVLLRLGEREGHTGRRLVRLEVPPASASPASPGSPRARVGMPQESLPYPPRNGRSGVLGDHGDEGDARIPTSASTLPAAPPRQAANGVSG